MIKIPSFSNLRALVIGDVMLDRFIYGSVTRISPESPAPLIDIDDSRTMLGGAGNVVRNLSALGAQVTLHSVVGDDANGKDILKLVGKEPRVVGNLITDPKRISTIKLRYVAEGQQLLRVDHETREPIDDETNRKILHGLCGEFQQHDVIILSDYKKGLLGRELMRLIINFAKEHGKPVIIDPKPRELKEYSGATVITPNVHELEKIAALSGCPFTNFDSDEGILDAAFWLSKWSAIDNIIVTRGKDGMTIVSKDGGFSHLKAQAHEVFDVSGAGDTVVATLALAIAAGLSIPESAELANMAAGIVVGRLGTSVVTHDDLELANISQRRIGGIHKIVSVASAKDVVSSWKRHGKRVGLTNGCFDLFHGGHSSSITEARARCDRLIVAINSDASTRQLKGDNRPMQSQYERAMILASMEAVDLVVIFDELTPLYVIEQLHPNILFKGSDYNAATVVGASIVDEVIILPRSHINSTSSLVEKAAATWKPEIVVNNEGARA